VSLLSYKTGKMILAICKKTLSIFASTGNILAPLSNLAQLGVIHTARSSAHYRLALKRSTVSASSAASLIVWYSTLLM